MWETNPSISFARAYDIGIIAQSRTCASPPPLSFGFHPHPAFARPPTVSNDPRLRQHAQDFPMNGTPHAAAYLPRS